MKTILKFLGNAVWILLILSIVYPVGWFFWRMGRAMEMPEYKGLTYFQFLSWRKNALHEMAVEYQDAHPEKKINFGPDQCFYLNLGVDSFGRLPTSSLYTLAGLYPDQFLRFVALDESDKVRDDVTWRTFLPAWWNGFEHQLWSGVKAGSYSQLPYCRLQPDLPSPDELESLWNPYRQVLAP